MRMMDLFEIMGRPWVRFSQMGYTDREVPLANFAETYHGQRIHDKLHHAPLINASKPQVWKKGSAAYWDKMGAPRPPADA